MTRGSLLIVDPSLAWPETQGAGEVAALWDGPTRVWTPALEPAEPPPRSARDHAAIVVLGSRASVHDEADWRSPLDDLLRPVIDGDLDRPLLGVCFGHQWLAALAGGTVAFAGPAREKIVGIRTTTFAPGRWFPEGANLSVVVSHREVVTRAPDGYRVVARRPDSPIDAIEHASRPLFGVQFHPEARDAFARGAGIDPAAVDARVVRDSRRVLAAFLDVARR